MSKDSKAQVIVDTYLDTCQTMTNKHEIWMQRYDLYERVDNLMFLCPECGRWCSTDEANYSEEGSICPDCARCNEAELEQELEEQELAEEAELEQELAEEAENETLEDQTES